MFSVLGNRAETSRGHILVVYRLFTFTGVSNEVRVPESIYGERACIMWKPVFDKFVNNFFLA